MTVVSLVEKSQPGNKIRSNVQISVKTSVADRKASMTRIGDVADLAEIHQVEHAYLSFVGYDRRLEHVVQLGYRCRVFSLDIPGPNTCL